MFCYVAGNVYICSMKQIPLFVRNDSIFSFIWRREGRNLFFLKLYICINNILTKMAYNMQIFSSLQRLSGFSVLNALIIKALGGYKKSVNLTLHNSLIFSVYFWLVRMLSGCTAFYFINQKSVFPVLKSIGTFAVLFKIRYEQGNGI